MSPYESFKGRNESEQEEFDRWLPSENCGHCNEPFHPDNLEPLAGTNLCPSCALEYREDHVTELLESLTTEPSPLFDMFKIKF